MLVSCGAKTIFVSYPLLELDARFLAKTILANPDIQFYVQVGHKKHVEFLQKTVREFDVKWHYFIDVNVGMDRTGLPIEEAFELYNVTSEEASFIFSGLHAYDGHVHQVNENKRRETARESMARLQKIHKQFFH